MTTSKYHFLLAWLWVFDAKTITTEVLIKISTLLRFICAIMWCSLNYLNVLVVIAAFSSTKSKFFHLKVTNSHKVSFLLNFHWKNVLKVFVEALRNFVQCNPLDITIDCDLDCKDVHDALSGACNCNDLCVCHKDGDNLESTKPYESSKIPISLLTSLLPSHTSFPLQCATDSGLFGPAYSFVCNVDCQCLHGYSIKCQCTIMRENLILFL